MRIALPPKKHRAVHRIDADDTAFAAQLTAIADLLVQHDATADIRERHHLRGRISEQTRHATGIAKAPAAATPPVDSKSK
jgi:hypothetical protein